jgi:SOS response regulatory protein OraA/RecX
MGQDDVEKKHSDSSALKDLADLLAIRSHSESELRPKLLRQHTEEAVEDALRIAKSKNWIESEAELAARVAASLAAKGKGHAFIADYLEAKGLSAPVRDSNVEIEKARELIKSKLAKAGSFDYDLSDEEKRKLFRFLAGRGFDEETILQALHLDGLDFSDSADF